MEFLASPSAPGPGRARAPWRIVGEAAAALAAGMGVGRFVFTPILPLMTAHAGLTAGGGATVATANYAGYLIGAAAGIAAPRIVRSSAVLRASLVVLVASLALMPATRSLELWCALRLIAGVASALVFMIAAAGLLSHLSSRGAHLTGWAFGGVGVGIALSGVLVLVIRATSTWTSAWIASAILTGVLAAAAWNLLPEPDHVRPAPDVRASAPRTHRWFIAVAVSYTLEGIGYIIAGTFLVAAIDQHSAGWVGGGAWVLAGIAAVPSSALWAWLSVRISRPGPLLAALVVQAIGIALPSVFGGVVPALVSAVLFGATFLGIATMALAVGNHLRFPRAVAILTTAYSIGQLLGPIIVTPLLHSGYRSALLTGSAVVLAAAVAAAILRIRFPRHVSSPGAPSAALPCRHGETTAISVDPR
jgi:MFS family permease